MVNTRWGISAPRVSSVRSREKCEFSGRNIAQNNSMRNRRSPLVRMIGVRFWSEISNTQEAIVARLVR